MFRGQYFGLKWSVNRRLHSLQGSAKRLCPGLVKFISAIAYHFCLNLPAAFMKPGRSLLAQLSRVVTGFLDVHVPITKFNWIEEASGVCLSTSRHTYTPSCLTRGKCPQTACWGLLIVIWWIPILTLDLKWTTSITVGSVCILPLTANLAAS